MAQLNILDLLERKTSVSLNVAEDIVAKVIRHKWKGAHDATNLYTSVEDSGLGKFSTRTKKIIRRLQRLDIIIKGLSRALESGELHEKAVNRQQIRLEASLMEKEYLESKI